MRPVNQRVVEMQAELAIVQGLSKFGHDVTAEACLGDLELADLYMRGQQRSKFRDVMQSFLVASNLPPQIQFEGPGGAAHGDSRVAA